MPAGAIFGALIGITIWMVAMLALFVYPLRAIVRTPRASIGRAKWAWALAAALPAGLSLALFSNALTVASAFTWLVYLAFLWRVRSPAWRETRRWRTPALGVAAALLVAYVGWELDVERARDRERQASREMDWPLHTETHVRLRLPADIRSQPGPMDSPGIGPTVPGGIAFERFWPGMSSRSAANKPVSEEIPNPLLLRIVALPIGTKGDDLQRFHDGAIARASTTSFAPTLVMRADGKPEPWQRITPGHLDEKDGAFSLGHVGVDLTRYPALHPSEYPMVYNEDIWVSPAHGGPPQVVITCPNDQVPAATLGSDLCDERFVDPALDAFVQVRFHAALLPQWQVIRGAVERRLADFVVPAPR